MPATAVLIAAPPNRLLEGVTLLLEGCNAIAEREGLSSGGASMVLGFVALLLNARVLRDLPTTSCHRPGGAERGSRLRGGLVVEGVL